jgi:hypothetical protein
MNADYFDNKSVSFSVHLDICGTFLQPKETMNELELQAVRRPFNLHCLIIHIPWRHFYSLARGVELTNGVDAVARSNLEYCIHALTNRLHRCEKSICNVVVESVADYKFDQDVVALGTKSRTPRPSKVALKGSTPLLYDGNRKFQSGTDKMANSWQSRRP